jgi:hypothetical protein
MEAVVAYYDGVAFVPTTPVKVKRNQQAIVTILDVPMQVPSVSQGRAEALAAAKKLRGMFANTDMSSEKFAAEKKTEKRLERV